MCKHQFWQQINPMRNERPEIDPSSKAPSHGGAR